MDNEYRQKENETDNIIPNKVQIVKDINVLNSFNVSNDHRLIKTKIGINYRFRRIQTTKKRHTHRFEKTKRHWKQIHRGSTA